MRSCARLAIAVVVLLVTSECVLAQAPRYSAGPGSGGGGPSLKRSTRPVVSRYTALLGSGVGANSAFGYQFFTRVQPQVATDRALKSLGRTVNQLEYQNRTLGSNALSLEQQFQQQQSGQVQAGSVNSIGTTGHTTSNLSHLRYFGTNQQQQQGQGGAGAGAGGAGGAGGAPGR